VTTLDLLRLVADRGGTLRTDRRGRIELAGPKSLLFDAALLHELARKRMEVAATLRAGRGASR